MSCGRAGNVNCSEVLERLYEFVDQELDNAYWLKLQGHLHDCAPCLRRVDLERLMKSLVARSCCEQAPPELRQRVIFSIRQVQTQFGEPKAVFGESPSSSFGESKPPFGGGWSTGS